jgi:hypothetical protein
METGSGLVMKPVLLTLLMCAVYVTAMSIAFRVRRVNLRTAGFLTRLFLMTLPVAVAIYCLTPRDLGFLPASLIENPVLEIVFLLFIYSSIFFGGIQQVYWLADRGFSLRISIDIDKSGGCMTVPEVIRSYSMGKGIKWMYQKRIDGLVEMKLIEAQGNAITVTASGRRVAVPLARVRRFLRIEA